MPNISCIFCVSDVSSLRRVPCGGKSQPASGPIAVLGVPTCHKVNQMADRITRAPRVDSQHEGPGEIGGVPTPAKMDLMESAR